MFFDQLAALQVQREGGRVVGLAGNWPQPPAAHMVSSPLPTGSYMGTRPQQKVVKLMEIGPYLIQNYENVCMVKFSSLHVPLVESVVLLLFLPPCQLGIL